MNVSLSIQKKKYVLRCSECERCGVPEVQHLPAGGRTQALARAQGRNVVLSPVYPKYVTKNVLQSVNATLPCFNSQFLPLYLPTTFPTLIPESALVSAWNSDSNLSLLIVRHPLARLVSVYYNKLVQYTYTQYSTVHHSTNAFYR